VSCNNVERISVG